jgi:hypothetical protein
MSQDVTVQHNPEPVRLSIIIHYRQVAAIGKFLPAGGRVAQVLGVSGRAARTTMGGGGKRSRAASSRLRRHRHATQAPALYGQPGRRRHVLAATTIRSR